jgi:hypothetical protein
MLSSMKLLLHKLANQVFLLKQVQLFPQLQPSKLTLYLHGRLSQKLMVDGLLIKLIKLKLDLFL